MTERIFDTSLYKDLSEIVRTAVITEDLAGLVLEAGRLPLENRINARKLVIRGEDVQDPIRGKSVFESFSEESEFDIRETTSARSFYRSLIDNPAPISVFSISAPGGEAGYLEGRVNVALRINEEEIEFYGIPTRLSAEELLNRAILLNEHSQANISFKDQEDLREISIPVIIPRGKNPWIFFEEVIPLDSNAWIAISEGRPWTMKEKANHDTKVVAEATSRQLRYAQTYRDYVLVGARAERMMMERGWKLDYSLCPGLFNFQILAIGDITHPFLIKDAFGNFRLSQKNFVRNCGNEKCGMPINDFIPKGYVCPHCGGTYEGC